MSLDTLNKKNETDDRQIGAERQNWRRKRSKGLAGCLLAITNSHAEHYLEGKEEENWCKMTK